MSIGYWKRLLLSNQVGTVCFLHNVTDDNVAIFIDLAIIDSQSQIHDFKCIVKAFRNDNSSLAYFFAS